MYNISRFYSKKQKVERLIPRTALFSPHSFRANNELCGFAKRLISLGLMTHDQVAEAESTALELNISLLQLVMDSELISTDSATLAAAWEYGLPVIDLTSIRVSTLPPLKDYPAQLLEKLNILPLARHNHRLIAAISSPIALTQLDELQFATGAYIDGVLAPIHQIKSVLIQYFAYNEHSTLNALDNFGFVDNELGIPSSEEDIQRSINIDIKDNEDAPIVKFVNKMLLEAVRRGASDIHFEPYENLYRVRFRVDGILVDIAHPSPVLRDRISARLKIMSRLDISERRLPQDGAIKLQLTPTHSIDCRVNTLPTAFGEKVVLRILDPTTAQLSIDRLGFSFQQQPAYEQALEKPQGMILVTGPTGSGKTVTLYTGISILNQIERNICTAEDPVEIKVPGINQVNIIPKIGLNFANALRAFLRQDPDVIMVGEIRDLETAEIAIKAAQTGHLVLSTVHTNSASETLTRLANMGVATYNIASSVSLIIAQRLARKLCHYCKVPAEIPIEALRKAGFNSNDIHNATIYKAIGCRECTQGYNGRIGVYEVVPITDEMRQLIMRDGNALDIDRQARLEGYPNLYHNCLSRVLDGTTSLDEVNRISKE